MTEERERELLRRYSEAAHGMQTGVAMLMERPFDDRSAEPKHLRVGVNSALVDSGALAGLLIDKGLITREEYLEAMAKAMEAERDRYQQLVREQFGNDSVFLH